LQGYVNGKFRVGHFPERDLGKEEMMYPTPGCFCERVRSDNKTIELREIWN